MIILLAACGSDDPASATYSDEGNETAAAVEPAPQATSAPVATETTAPTEVPVATEVPAPTAAEEPEASEEPASAGGAEGDGLFPTVVDAVASSSDGTSWRFDVTLSSEYDSPARYADAWRVLDADDTELGIRVLGHDHANEQPFTRSTNVDVPADVQVVFIEGRDQVNGWSGERFQVVLNR